jgi:nitroimidazol reductase NimA-like FMN-containing flavoprotein (pyridoxamine 5'-phosphate oxidase superfamily)
MPGQEREANTPQAQQPQPIASRPHIPGYGIPETEEGMLDWSHVVERMKSPQNYWVGTTRPDGRPHVVPVWGVWVEGTFYHGGGPNTRKARNLAENPAMVVHLESGDEVVIIEGGAEMLTQENADPALLEKIDDAYEAKYGMRHGTPVWALQPQVAFAWTKYPDNVTRWRFKKL